MADHLEDIVIPAQMSVKFTTGDKNFQIPNDEVMWCDHNK